MKAGRDCDGTQIPYGWAHATFTMSPAGMSCNYMDSSRWHAKKGTPEDDMAQNIPERVGEGENHMGGSLDRQAAARCAELPERN